ncbi:MAG: hypothetical protein U0T81_10940 [Saprospiraceae bacterium]
MRQREAERTDYTIIPFIEGDGTGRNIWTSSVRVIDAAVDKAYQAMKNFMARSTRRRKSI